MKELRSKSMRIIPVFAVALVAAAVVPSSGPASASRLQQAPSTTYVSTVDSSASDAAAANPAEVQVLAASPGVRRLTTPSGTVRGAATEAGGDGVGVMASEPPTCWTVFAPPWPAGIEMTQYYRNCNGRAINAFGGWRDAAGVHDATGCYFFPDGAYIHWFHGATAAGTYSTFLC